MLLPTRKDPVLAPHWDPNLADDLSQEVVVRVCQFVLRNERTRITWALLEGFMKNVFREHCRQRHRASLQLDSYADLPDAEALPPGDMTEAEDTHQTIWALVRRLGVEERAVLIGRHYWGMNGTELARFLGIPRTTLIDRYNHAMDTLRRWLVERGVLL